MGTQIAEETTGFRLLGGEELEAPELEVVALSGERLDCDLCRRSVSVLVAIVVTRLTCCVAIALEVRARLVPATVMLLHVREQEQSSGLSDGREKRRVGRPGRNVETRGRPIDNSSVVLYMSAWFS